MLIDWIQAFFDQNKPLLFIDESSVFIFSDEIQPFASIDPPTNLEKNQIKKAITHGKAGHAGLFGPGDVDPLRRRRGGGCGAAGGGDPLLLSYGGGGKPGSAVGALPRPEPADCSRGGRPRLGPPG